MQIDRYQELPEKSPVLAGVMSAILPGSGYIYAEHYGDGITAFLINGLFIAGTITAIHQENYAVAGIVGGVGVPFYLGNIYGSATRQRNGTSRAETKSSKKSTRPFPRFSDGGPDHSTLWYYSLTIRAKFLMSRTVILSNQRVNPPA